MVQLAAEGTLSGELGVTLWLSASVLDLSQSWVPGKWAARWEQFMLAEGRQSEEEVEEPPGFLF